MKKYYRRKGSYKDGRMKMVIESKTKKKTMSRTLPNPDIMWEMLGHLKKEKFNKENKDT
jgi:hypothetical protein